MIVTGTEVSREEFFENFAFWSNGQEVIEYCKAIPNAFVPIIEIKIKGMEIDLAFARETSNPELIMDPRACYDPVSKRSLNGLALSRQISSAMGNNITFQAASKTIKLWAQSECELNIVNRLGKRIYGNAYGYLNGITIEVMVAKLFRDHSLHSDFELVADFFVDVP